MSTSAACRFAAGCLVAASLGAGWVVAAPPWSGARPSPRDPAPIEDYAEIFGPRYADAERFVRENAWIGRELGLPRQDQLTALAIVFPELIRFSALEDEIQVRGLKVLYVQYGRAYANFSIGRFQMKPSFTEQVERDARRLLTPGERAAAGVPIFAGDDTPSARAERIRRLDEGAWQVRYLRLFMQVMARRYADEAFAGTEDRLRFYATAYNAGYASGTRALRQKALQRTFHTALFFPDVRYCYADVAVFSYRRLAGWWNLDQR